MAQTIILKDVRLSYNDLFTPREYQPGDGKPRYSATVLIEPGSENHKTIMAAIQAEMKEKFGEKAKARYAALKGDKKSFCYIPGEIKDPEDEDLEGKFVLSVHRQANKGAPAVVDKNPSKKLTAADGKPYSGCYVNLKAEIYAQTQGNIGVRGGLLGIQFSKDGQAFAGGPANAEGFDNIDDGSDADDFGGDDDFEGSNKKPDDLDDDIPF